MARTTKQKLKTPTEIELWQDGYNRIAGVDEAGRGPLAGPVVAAACIFKKGYTHSEVQDSKVLTAKERDTLYHALIHDPNVSWAFSIQDAQIIDSINILQATLLAMKEAVDKLTPGPDYILVDGNKKIPHTNIPCVAIPKADALISCVSAASIIAKVIRDAIMDEFHQKYPQYGFCRHKGYGTEEHIAMLKKHGPCPIHRVSFEPIKTSMLKPESASQLELFK